MQNRPIYPVQGLQDRFVCPACEYEEIRNV
jgi:hypothetical protein